MSSRRRKKAGLGIDYIALSTCDYDDENQSGTDSEAEREVELDPSKKVIRRVRGGNGCYQFIFILSICGAVFLTIIAYLLHTNSIYLRIKHKSIQGGRKGLASSVFIAAIMYVLVAIFTVSSTKIKWKKITIESQLGTCSVEWSVV